jgi:hypothetical protein
VRKTAEEGLPADLYPEAEAEVLRVAADLVEMVDEMKGTNRRGGAVSAEVALQALVEMQICLGRLFKA